MYRIKQRVKVINILPQQSVGLHFLPPSRAVFFEFPLRTHLFGKMIQQTHWRHIHKALYCMLFVMFESFGELITLERRHGRGNVLHRVHLRPRKRKQNSRPAAKCLLFFPGFALQKKRATVMHQIVHNRRVSKTHAVYLRSGPLPSVQT